MKIAVIGTGYVGLVTGSCFADFNNEVDCIDIDIEKIEKLNKGIIPIFEPGLEEIIKKNVKAKRLFFKSKLGDSIMKCDAIIIAVGTPSKENGDVDTSFIESAIIAISKYLTSYKVIIIKSTVPPGTTIQLKNLLKSNNVDKNHFDIISNPEFLREGSAVGDFMIPDRIIIGTDSSKAMEIMNELYRSLFLREIPLIETDHTTAELIKYATNTFLATKISYINEIARLCITLGADINTISKSLGLDGRISSKFLHPGPGFGGSCFPKDVLGLSNIAKNNKIEVNVIQGVLETNAKQKLITFNNFISLISGDIKGKKIAVLGLSFKPKTDDIREAPSLVIIKELLKVGAVVYGYDPIAVNNMKEKFSNVNFTNDLNNTLKGAHGVILLTEWNELRSLNPLKVLNLMEGNVFFDSRNIYEPDKWKKAGFIFGNMGRLR